MSEPTLKPSDMADAELPRAYKQTTGRANDMVANALLAEIERRKLGI
jgi:hypothetical protein